MALIKSKVISKDEWEQLPEDERPIFRQKADDPDAYEYAVPELHRSMVNAKQERDRYKSDLEQARSRVSAFDKFGDPSKIEELMQRESMIMDQSKTIEEQITRANAEAREREAGRVKALQEERDAYRTNLLDFATKNVIDTLISGSGIDPSYEEEARLACERRLKTEFQDGVPVTYVMSEKNSKELARDPETGDPLTPQKFFLLYKQSKGKIFAGETNGSGSGFNNARGAGAGSLDDKDPITWTWQERREWTSRNPSPEAWRNLQEKWDKKRAAMAAAKREAEASARF